MSENQGEDWQQISMPGVDFHALAIAPSNPNVFYDFPRLFPVLPFNLISYGAGMTGLSLSIYTTATLLGMIPSTFFPSYAVSAFTIGLPQGIAL